MFKNFMSERFFERWSSFTWHLLWKPIFKIWLQWKRKKIFNLTHLQISKNYWLNIFILCIVFPDTMTNALWAILLSLVNKSVYFWTHNQMKYIQLQGMDQSIKRITGWLIVTVHLSYHENIPHSWNGGHFK